MLAFHTKVLIIGSGPAGCTAAIYSARAGLQPIMVSGNEPGGQLTITTEVENYPGFKHPIQGPFLMDEMIAQAENVGTKIIREQVVKIDFGVKPFEAYTDYTKYTADSVIICTGAQAKWLGIPSEKEYSGFGVSGCATCDGFFFKNKPVLVVGGGNTAVEEALYLSKLASKVTLIHRRDSLRAEKILQQRLFDNPKIEILWNCVLENVLGTQDPKRVVSANIKNILTHEYKEIAVDGIFIAIGHKPNTELFKNIIDMDDDGYIVTKGNSTATNISGVFAAGDVQDKIYRQAVTAAGTGCMAALEAEKFLHV